jgi:polyisoprenoid-binding protein YceI
VVATVSLQGATLKRTDWGMKYGVPAIGDDVRLWFSVEGYKE